MNRNHVIVMNKAQAIAEEPRPYAALISIYTPGDTPPPVSVYWSPKLLLAFHDSVPEKGDPDIFNIEDIIGKFFTDSGADAVNLFKQF